MAISFQSALGIHEQALHLRVQRSQVLASNLANADTPNYKARDIDFQSVLQAQNAGVSTGMRTTHSRHMGGLGSSSMTGFSAETLYRVPQQPSLDGNTVEEQIEMAEFAKNTLDFQASLRFLNGKFSSMKDALSGRGE